jgi:N-acetylglucosamine-6-sulfatase
MTQKSSRPSRRRFLGTMGAAVATAPLLAGTTQTSLSLKKVPGRKPRNVIFILSDDHRYDFMGFMGRPEFLETPNMDRMAREGAHLQNAFVSTSLCSPSRASILTGQYAHKHGVVDNNTLVPKGTIFFPQYLQEIGYETAFMGKWHMGHDNDEPRPGFDRWLSFRGQGVYYDPTFNIDGERVERKGYITDLLTDYAVDWLKQDRSKPFFLYLSHKAVHAMFRPAKRHLGKYDTVTLPYPKTMANTEENYRGKPSWVKEQRNSWHGVDYMYHGQMDFDTFYRRYCETVLGIDESIGRVLAYLEESGLADATLVFYMGDNGFLFGEHGLIDKRCMYEESIRVPLLAYCPEIIKPGTKITQMVQNIDIAPTILDAAGLKAPENMDGRSMLPLLRCEEISWRDAILYEYYWERNFPQTPTVHGVRTDHYKYMHYHGIWDIDELYDINNDPEETQNLINSPDHQELVRELNQRMFDMLDETGGMLIPLRRDRGKPLNQRRPK